MSPTGRVYVGRFYFAAVGGLVGHSLFSGEVQPVDDIPHDEDGSHVAEYDAVEAQCDHQRQKRHVQVFPGLEGHLRFPATEKTLRAVGWCYCCCHEGRCSNIKHSENGGSGTLRGVNVSYSSSAFLDKTIYWDSKYGPAVTARGPVVPVHRLNGTCEPLDNCIRR